MSIFGNRGKTATEEDLSLIKSGKKLVAFYSWGSNTKVVAEYIAEKTGADLLELKVRDEYPSDYDVCVSKVGHDGRNYEPELSVAIPDLSTYQTVFAGSPCWWGSIANPLRTFLHQNDFTEKSVIPFMTHGTSGLHMQDVKNLCSGAQILKGLGIFNKYQVMTKVNTPKNMGVWQKDVDQWLSGLGL